MGNAKIVIIVFVVGFVLGIVSSCLAPRIGI